MSKLENAYQASLIKDLRALFPGCVIQKLDTSYQQGIPDLLILFRDQWAVLEVKRKKPKASDFEPNQEWWIEHLDSMSFGACIYPENEKEVLHDLQRAFGIYR